MQICGETLLGTGVFCGGNQQAFCFPRDEGTLHKLLKMLLNQGREILSAF